MFMNHPRASRREFLRTGAVSVGGASVAGWFAPTAQAIAANRKKTRSVILLWMSGGPATIDLWDLKPGHANGGPFKDIATNAPGLRISEHLPTIASFGQELAIVRGMSTKEGDHTRASFNLRTGQTPTGPIDYPTFGSLISKEIGDTHLELPNFVSIAPRRFFEANPQSPGFLGPQHAPLIVGNSNDFNEPVGDNLHKRLTVDNIHAPKHVSVDHANARAALLQQMQDEFTTARSTASTQSHAAAYDRAMRLMQSDASKVFELDTETAATRERYGKSLFGQGCLLARRLVEKGVAFVEITMSGWDTHGNNFDQVKTLSGHLDKGWGSLMQDLRERGLLDTTLIVCVGEFGRTPRINSGSGRDHYPNAWSTVLAGGGINGGQAIGKTSSDGTTVEERKTTTNDFLSTVCKIVGVDHEKQNMSNVGRPIRIVDKPAEPLTEVFA